MLHLVDGVVELHADERSERVLEIPLPLVLEIVILSVSFRHYDQLVLMQVAVVRGHEDVVRLSASLVSGWIYL